MTEPLHRLLRRFNRRERQLLFEWAYDVRLPGLPVRMALREHLGLDHDIPECAYAAVDYPIDWLVGALAVFTSPLTLEPGATVDPPWKDRIHDSSEDVDLLIAYTVGSVERLILVEAKAFTGWDGKQLQSKVARLKAIFDDRGFLAPNLQASWVMVAPKAKLPNVQTAHWQPWMKPTSVLQLPQPDLARWRLQRWNTHTQKPDKQGDARRVIGDNPWETPYDVS